jgi:hypothetical protein
MPGMALIRTKWPLLLVTGKPVTEEQADDILLRTSAGYWHTNDRQWRADVSRILGVPLDDHGDFGWRDLAAWRKSIGALDLHHLSNGRIMSSWIGGPKGWCDWDGRIGCGNWNIGKWPEVAEIEEDLAAISAAWPFLDMRVQLIDDEGDGQLCGEWRVWDGQWTETEPGPRIDEPDLNVEAAAISLIFASSGRERGVSPDRLAAAWARVRPQPAS